MGIKSAQQFFLFLKKKPTPMNDVPPSSPILVSSPVSSGYGGCFCAIPGCPGDCDTFPIYAPPTRQLIVTRLDTEAVDDLMFLSTNLKEDPFWQPVTHLAFGGLMVDGGGRVKTDLRNVLDSPTTYVPVIESVCARWGIDLVWTLPSFAEDEFFLHNVMVAPAFVRRFWSSLYECIDKHAITRLEFDLHTLAAVLLNSPDPDTVVMQLRQKECRLWIGVCNAVPFLDTAKMETLMEFVRPLFERIVLRSSGFFDIKLLPTSKGRYRTMILAADNGLSAFDCLYNHVSHWCTNAEVLMELPTSGIEYAMNPADQEVVDKYRHVALSEIKQRLRFGSETYQRYADTKTNISMVYFPDSKTWLSYDNENVRRGKLHYAKTHQLGGIVIGQLNDDLAPNHESSLLNAVAAAVL